MCGQEFSDLSQHLVIFHDVLSIEHLHSLMPKKASEEVKVIDEELSKSISEKKEILKLLIDIQSNPRYDLRIKNIEKIKSLLMNYLKDDKLISSAINSFEKNTNSINIPVQRSVKEALNSLLASDISENNKLYIIKILGPKK